MPSAPRELMLKGSFMLKISYVASALLLSSVMPHGEARANDGGFFSSFIPASACAPATATDADQLELANGSWAFISTEFGSAKLICPVSDSWRSTSGVVQQIPEFFVWYRDTDGNTQDTNVHVQMKHRAPTALSPVSFELPFNSSLSPTKTNTRDSVFWSNGTATASDGIYFFEVTLSRATTGQTAALHALSFLP